MIKISKVIFIFFLFFISLKMSYGQKNKEIEALINSGSLFSHKLISEIFKNKDEILSLQKGKFFGHSIYPVNKKYKLVILACIDENFTRLILFTCDSTFKAIDTKVLLKSCKKCSKQQLFADYGFIGEGYKKIQIDYFYLKKFGVKPLPEDIKIVSKERFIINPKGGFSILPE